MVVPVKTYDFLCAVYLQECTLKWPSEKVFSWGKSNAAVIAMRTIWSNLKKSKATPIHASKTYSMISKVRGLEMRGSGQEAKKKDPTSSILWNTQVSWPIPLLDQVSDSSYTLRPFLRPETERPGARFKAFRDSGSSFEPPENCFSDCGVMRIYANILHRLQGKSVLGMTKTPIG